MTRFTTLAVVFAVFLFAGTGHAQTSADYESMTIDEMVEQGTDMVADMVRAVERVAELRRRAEAEADPSTYQRLNNFYTRMNSRLLYAEEALEVLRDLRAGSSSKATRKVVTGADPTAANNFAIIQAAHVSIMGDLQQAESLMGNDFSGGDGVQVSGGSGNLPEQGTNRGDTTTPRAQERERDNSSFQGRTPSSALGSDA